MEFNRTTRQVDYNRNDKCPHCAKLYSCYKLIDLRMNEDASKYDGYDSLECKSYAPSGSERLKIEGYMDRKEQFHLDEDYEPPNYKDEDDNMEHLSVHDQIEKTYKFLGDK